MLSYLDHGFLDNVLSALLGESPTKICLKKVILAIKHNSAEFFHRSHYTKNDFCALHDFQLERLKNGHFTSPSSF